MLCNSRTNRCIDRIGLVSGEMYVFIVYLNVGKKSIESDSFPQVVSDAGDGVIQCHSPCVFSIKMTLESELKFCPVRIICWPPRTEQLSMSCFSTMGSSCAERWAAGTHRGAVCYSYCLSTVTCFTLISLI